jgi:hypothetical protein
VPNKATQEIREFARNILMSDGYRRSLVRRIEAGKAPHMEVLLHHYAFGKPKHTYVEPAPAKQSAFEQALERMSSEEVCEMNDLYKRINEMEWLALARPTTGRLQGAQEIAASATETYPSSRHARPS